MSQQTKPIATPTLSPQSDVSTRPYIISTTTSPSVTITPISPAVMETRESLSRELVCFSDEMSDSKELEVFRETILFVHQLSPEQEIELQDLLHWDRYRLSDYYAFAFPDHQYEFETVHASEVMENRCHDISFVYGSELSAPFMSKIPEVIRFEESLQQILIEDRVYQGEDISLVINVPYLGAHQNRIILLMGHEDTAVKYGLTNYLNYIFSDTFDYIITNKEFPLEAGRIDPENGQINNYKLWEQKEWKVRRALHYNIFYRPNSLAQEELDYIISFQESAYVRIRDLIGWVDQPINIYLYDSLEDKEGQLGIGGNGYAVPPSFSTHSIYSEDGKAIGGHETTHVIASHTLRHSFVPLLSEGLAVYLSNPEGSFKPEHSSTKFFLENGGFIPLAQLIDNMSFWQLDATISYPLAGSFVKFLIEEYGMTKFTQLYREMESDNGYEKLEEIYELPLPKLEEAWIETVEEFEEN